MPLFNSQIVKSENRQTGNADCRSVPKSVGESLGVPPHSIIPGGAARSDDRSQWGAFRRFPRPSARRFLALGTRSGLVGCCLDGPFSRLQRVFQGPMHDNAAYRAIAKLLLGVHRRCPSRAIRALQTCGSAAHRLCNHCRNARWGRRGGRHPCYRHPGEAASRSTRRMSHVRTPTSQRTGSSISRATFTRT